MSQRIYKEQSDTSSTSGTYSQANRVNLWEMPKYNQIHKSFTTIDGKQTGRNVRQEYCYNKYREYIGSKMLDVGCGDAIMRGLHHGSYTGVDVSGTPDLVINLENENFPFEPNHFDTTICLEVLEHLDNPHDVLSELVRVSKDYVIISLPNCWRQIYYHLANGHTDLPEYGFPNNKPLDRHKWFFGPKEAFNFIYGNAQKYGYSIERVDHITNDGGLLRTTGVEKTSKYTFPPNLSPLDMDFLQRIHFRYWKFKEWCCRKALINDKAWRNDVDIINSWFVLKKLPK